MSHTGLHHTFWVGVFVGSELSWYNKSKLEVIILGWVLLFVVLPEGCRYIRDGILDCSQSQGVISCCWKCYLSDSHGRGVNDLIAVGSCEGVEEDVVAETNNGCEVLSKSIPTCSFTGIFSSNEVSHELILFVSVTIWKCCGRWEGHCQETSRRDTANKHSLELCASIVLVF